MGRQPNAPSEGRNGNYWAWHPAIKKRIDLGTRDYGQACAIQSGFYPGRQAPATVASARTPTMVPPLGDPSFPYRLSGDGVIDLDSPSDDKPADAGDLLSRWAAVKDPNVSVATPSASAPVVQPSGIQSTLVSLMGGVHAPNTPGSGKGGSQRGKSSLTPEQSAKLAGGLKKIMANLNCIIVGAGVQMFGRVPAPIDDEEMELLQMGWEMFIDEMFAKAKVKPWHVLLAGNVMIAAAMYVGGTPIPKKALPADAGKAKSATVTPIDGGKKDA